MRIEQFEYIIAIAESGSMHAASERLHVSQQNISKMIKQLEDELHIQIFFRSNFGTCLTSEGQDIYQHACTIIREVSLLKQKYMPLSSYQKSLQGTLKIHTSNGLVKITDSFIQPFHRLYPNVKIMINELDSREYLSLLRGTNDIEILFLQYSLEKLLQENEHIISQYTCYLITDEQLKVIMSTASPYAQNSTISLTTLSHLPLIANSSSTSKLPCHIQLLVDLGIPLNLQFILNSESLITKYISNNMAYGLSTASNIKMIESNPHICFVPIKEKIHVATCLLIRKTNLSLPSNAFISVFLSNKTSDIEKIF